MYLCTYDNRGQVHKPTRAGCAVRLTTVSLQHGAGRRGGRVAGLPSANGNALTQLLHAPGLYGVISFVARAYSFEFDIFLAFTFYDLDLSHIRYHLIYHIY